MPFAIAVFTIGLVALYAGVTNQSIASVINMKPGQAPKPNPETATAGPTPTTGTDGTSSPGSVGNGSDRATLLVSIGHEFETRFHLTVSECDAPGAPASWGPVHRVHTPTSLHYRHRAFDASGTEANMHDACVWVRTTHGSDLAELIHNPGFAIKNGKDVNGPVFYAAVWAGHRGHVHVGA